MPSPKDDQDRDSLKGHFGKPDGGYETQSKGAGQAHDHASADGEALYGEHVSGRYGAPAYGRTGGGGRLPTDPSQQSGSEPTDITAGTTDAGQNAQISGGSGYQPMPQSKDNERDAPGISTDKASDDTKPW